MSKFNRYLELIFVCLVMVSCITTQRIPIDQLEPGKVNLPEQVRKVALISRNFKFSIDTLSNYWNLNFRLNKGLKRDNQFIDSASTAQSLDNLRKALVESGRIDEVYVYPYNAIKPHREDKELPLSSGFIQSLCTESETDAVISLEMLSSFYSRHNAAVGGQVSAEATAKVTAIWSVYTPKRDEPVDRFTHSEVIRWGEKEHSQNHQKHILPDRREAISAACGIAAKNYSKRIVPYWTESSRLLIGLDKPEFVDALSYATKNKWKEASRIWEKYTNNPQTRVAGIAALNYAVAQEMLGDFAKAALWSDKSVKLLRNGEAGRIARGYAAILYQRELKASKLNSLLKISHP